jgi:AraC family transcriptional regulator
MIPTLKTIAGKKLIGHHRTMSFQDNSTFTLWSRFMPLRNSIINTVGPELYSVQFYVVDFFKKFNSNNPFEKWACREVLNFEDIPDGMSTIEIPEGLYAVFHYKGDNSTAAEAYNYIFTEWLPKSDYLLDSRPHFEILGEAYKYNDPDSEEDIYIPIQAKKKLK